MAYSINLSLTLSESLHSVKLMKNSNILGFICVTEFSW